MVDAINTGQYAIVKSMLNNMHLPLEEEDCITKLASSLPHLVLVGQNDIVDILLRIISQGAHWWRGQYPVACRVVALCSKLNVPHPSIPLPSVIEAGHMRAMAKYGMASHLKLALAMVHLPHEDCSFAELLYLAAGGGHQTVVNILYDVIGRHGDTLSDELLVKDRWSISAPWSDTESLFWSVVVYFAVRYNHKLLAKDGMHKIVSAAFNTRKILTDVAGNDGATVLHWICFWGIEDLLVHFEGLVLEDITSTYSCPQSPLEYALAVGNIPAVSQFIGKSDVTPKMVKGILNISLRETLLKLPDRFVSPNKSRYVNVPSDKAALFYVLTLGWFSRLMQPATAPDEVTEPDKVTEGFSHASVVDQNERNPVCRSKQGLHPVMMSLRHFISSLQSGKHRNVAAYLWNGRHTHVIQQLLLQMYKDDCQIPFLEIAVMSGSLLTIKALLSAFKKIPRIVLDFRGDSVWFSPLLMGAACSFPSSLTHLLSCGADIRSEGQWHRNVLHIAVLSKCTQSVKVLLEDKRSRLLISKKDDFCSSPLEMATANGQYEMVKLMKESLPAIKWKEIQKNSDQSLLEGTASLQGGTPGWFRLLMEQNEAGWPQELQVLPSLAYQTSTFGFLDNPHFIYSVAEASVGQYITKAYIQEMKRYTPGFTMVALLKKDLFLPHMSLQVAIHSAAQFHHDVLVQLVDACLRFHVSVPDAESGDLFFLMAAQSGNHALLECLVKYGILASVSSEMIVTGLQHMLGKGHLQMATLFMQQAGIPTLDISWQENGYPILLQSIFDSSFNYVEHFDLASMTHLVDTDVRRNTISRMRPTFELQEGWLSFGRRWTKELLERVLRNRHIQKVVDLRNQYGATIISLSPSYSLRVLIDWPAFDLVAQEMRENGGFQFCPLLTECLVTALVVKPVIHTCSTLALEGTTSQDVSLTVQLDGTASWEEGFSGITISLSYSTEEHSLVFPVPPTAEESVQEVPSETSPGISVSSLVRDLASSSLSLSSYLQLSIECIELKELWNSGTVRQEDIVCSLVHLFRDLKSVMQSLLSRRPVLRSSNQLLGDDDAEVDLSEFVHSHVVFAYPVLRNWVRRTEITIQLSEEGEAVCTSSVEDNTFFLSFSLLVTVHQEGPEMVEVPSYEMMFNSIAHSVFQAVSDNIIRKLCRQIKNAFDLVSLDERAVSVLTPWGTAIDDITDSGLQACLLRWLMSPRSDLPDFLGLFACVTNGNSYLVDVKQLIALNGITIEMGSTEETALKLESGKPVLFLGSRRSKTLETMSCLPRTICEAVVYEDVVNTVVPSKCRLVSLPRFLLALEENTFELVLCNHLGDPISNMSEDPEIDVSIRPIHRAYWMVQHSTWPGDYKYDNPRIQRKSHNTFTIKWSRKRLGLYRVQIKVNGGHIACSPQTIFAGSTMDQEVAANYEYLSRHPPLTHNYRCIYKPFSYQDLGCIVTCGTGRPLIFLISHSDKTCDPIRTSVLAKLQRCSLRHGVTGFRRKSAPAFERGMSTSDSPLPPPMVGGTNPIHHLTACNLQGGVLRWKSYAAGHVQVFLRSKQSAKKIHSAKKPEAYVHSSDLGNGLYRLAILQTKCGPFKLMVACSKCQKLLKINSDFQSVHTEPYQTMCTVLPGTMVPKFTRFSLSLKELKSRKNRTPKKGKQNV